MRPHGQPLDDHKLSAKHQRRWATEGVLKAGLLSNGFPESMIIHSDGARQFDTVFEHSPCWFHASRPLAKLLPTNSRLTHLTAEFTYAFEQS